jgi:phosphoribosylformylglycinamidine (FGAM) synthase PurS component
MTIFRRDQRQADNQPYKKIAEFAIEGSIIIQETARSLAYQQGITTGASFAVVVNGHDNDSNNMLDQIQTTYIYNPFIEEYEESKVTRIPGSQIEQRRLRELLSGAPGVFENFISDLWYYVSPQGTLDSRQYLYFNPSGKEVIFFGDETQQVFVWQRSTPTRYGLYITTQNISISTLRRFIDIELESLDSIRLRVFEDVKLKITVSASWDGSYRRAIRRTETEEPFKNTIDAQYDSSWGRIQFSDKGEYFINSSGIVRKGRYAFFKVNDQKLLEMRPEYESAESRMVYRVDTGGNDILNLTRVRIGATGIHDLFEGQITFIPPES